MIWMPPDYLQIPADKLGAHTPVRVRVRGDQQDVAEDMARAIMKLIRDCQAVRQSATFILPVGPVDQFPFLADMINAKKIDCRDVVLINMDEYLGDADQWVP